MVVIFLLLGVVCLGVFSMEGVWLFLFLFLYYWHEGVWWVGLLLGGGIGLYVIVVDGVALWLSEWGLGLL